MDDISLQRKVSLFPFEKSVSFHEKNGQISDFTIANQNCGDNHSQNSSLFTTKIKKKLSFVSKWVSVRFRENFTKPPSECGESIGSNDQWDDFNYASYWTATMTMENISGLKSEILSPIKRLDSIDSMGSHSSTSIKQSNHCSVEEVYQYGFQLSPSRRSVQENEFINSSFSFDGSTTSRPHSRQETIIHDENMAIAHDYQDSIVDALATLGFEENYNVPNYVDDLLVDSNINNFNEDVFDHPFKGSASSSNISSSHYESHSFDSIQNGHVDSITSALLHDDHVVEDDDIFHSSLRRSLGSELFPPVLSNSIYISIDHSDRPHTETSTITTSSTANSNISVEEFHHRDPTEELNTNSHDNVSLLSNQTRSSDSSNTILSLIDAVRYSSDDSDTAIVSPTSAALSQQEDNDEIGSIALDSNVSTAGTEERLNSTILCTQTEISEEQLNSEEYTSLYSTTVEPTENVVECTKSEELIDHINFISDVDTNIYPEETIPIEINNPLQTMKMNKEKLTRIPHMDSMTSIYAESAVSYQSSDSIEGQSAVKSGRFFMSMSPLAIPQFSKLFSGESHLKQKPILESNHYDEDDDDEFTTVAIKKDRGDSYVLQIASIYNKNRGNRTPDRLTPQSNPMSTKSNEKSAATNLSGARKGKGLLGDWSYRSIYKSITSSDYTERSLNSCVQTSVKYSVSKINRLNNSNTMSSPQPTKESVHRINAPLNAEALASFDKLIVKKAQLRKLTLAAREDLKILKMIIERLTLHENLRGKIEKKVPLSDDETAEYALLTAEIIRQERVKSYMLNEKNTKMYTAAEKAELNALKLELERQVKLDSMFRKEKNNETYTFDEKAEYLLLRESLKSEQRMNLLIQKYNQQGHSDDSDASIPPAEVVDLIVLRIEQEKHKRYELLVQKEKDSKGLLQVRKGFKLTLTEKSELAILRKEMELQRKQLAEKVVKLSHHLRNGTVVTSPIRLLSSPLVVGESFMDCMNHENETPTSILSGNSSLKEKHSNRSINITPKHLALTPQRYHPHSAHKSHEGAKGDPSISIAPSSSLESSDCAGTKSTSTDNSHLSSARRDSVVSTPGRIPGRTQLNPAIQSSPMRDKHLHSLKPCHRVTLSTSSPAGRPALLLPTHRRVDSSTRPNVAEMVLSEFISPLRSAQQRRSREDSVDEDNDDDKTNNEDSSPYRHRQIHSSTRSALSFSSPLVETSRMRGGDATAASPMIGSAFYNQGEQQQRSFQRPPPVSQSRQTNQLSQLAPLLKSPPPQQPSVDQSASRRSSSSSTSNIKVGWNSSNHLDSSHKATLHYPPTHGYMPSGKHPPVASSNRMSFGRMVEQTMLQLKAEKESQLAKEKTRRLSDFLRKNINHNSTVATGDTVFHNRQVLQQHQQQHQYSRQVHHKMRESHPQSISSDIQHIASSSSNDSISRRIRKFRNSVS